jgi:hypothetical protein
LRAIFRKLDVRSRVELARLVIEREANHHEASMSAAGARAPWRTGPITAVVVCGLSAALGPRPPTRRRLVRRRSPLWAASRACRCAPDR